MAEINLGKVVGDNAPILQIQYSVSGLSWHSDYQAGDSIQRQSADGGINWSNPMPISGSGSFIDEDIQSIGVGTTGSIDELDVVPSGTNITEFAKMILRRNSPPTYTIPTMSLEITSSLTVEVGSSGNVILMPNFAQNDGGAVTGVVYSKDGVSIHTEPTISFYIYPNVATEGLMVFSVEVIYSQGDVKNDLFGNPDPNGRIDAGTISANANLLGAYRTWFGSTDAYPVQGDIRDFANNSNTYEDSFTLNTGTTQLNHFIAIPAAKNLVSVIDQDALGVDLTSAYELSGIATVPDGGGINASYKVYVMTLSTPYSSNHRHNVTIQ